MQLFRIGLFLLLLCFLKSTLHASRFVFEQLSTKQGLSQNNVNCILQDSRGFMWFGTSDGLNRYDGYEFKTFRINLDESTGLSSNLIRCLAEDQNGNIWIGTTDRGINLYDPSKDEIQKIIPENINPNPLINEGVFSILPSTHNEIWLLTQDKIYILIQHEGKYLIKQVNSKDYLDFDSNSLRCLHQQSDNKVLVGTINGLYLCQKLDDSNYNISLFPQTKSNHISDLTPFQNGILVSSYENLQYIDPDGAFHDIDNPAIKTFCVDDQNNLWAGTENGLLLYKHSPNPNSHLVLIKAYTQENTNNRLTSDYIRCIVQDKFGIIWVGTWGGGLTKINKKGNKFNHYKENINSVNLANYRIRAIFEDSENNLWIGTEGGGTSVLKNGNLEYKSGFIDLDMPLTTSKNHLAYHEITRNNKKVVITGSAYPIDHKAYQIERDKIIPTDLPKKLKNIQSQIYALESDDRYLWLGTYGQGLFRYTLKGDTLVNFLPGEKSAPSSIVRSLLNDSQNRLWIGTDKGLNMLAPQEKNKKTPSFIVYTSGKEEGRISHNYILPIIETSDKDIWIGTLGGGLNKYIENANIFQNISTKHGLPNNNIKGIMQDSNKNLWVSSNKGISKLDLQNFSITNYNISDGLQDYEFRDMTFCKRENGEMLFGGVNGFNAFFPESIQEDKSAPILTFTDIHILNKPIKPGEKFNGRVVLEQNINSTQQIKLKFKENSFMVFFTALHFTAPGKIQYKYRLKGFDTEWVETSPLARFARYTNLLPGKYTLQVLATNSDGVWVKEPINLDIKVIRPWWLKNISIVGYVLILIFAFVFFRRFSIIKIKMKNALMMERFEKEKMRELTHMKLRFFTNISHEFRTPLTLVINYLDKLSKQWKTSSEENVNANFEITQRNANILLRLINQLMDFRRFEQGKMKINASQNNLSEFIKQIAESFNILAENKKIKFALSLPPEDIHLWYDQGMMEKIIYNLLSNAFKYTQEEGSVNINISQNETHVKILISDSGIGIPKEMQKHIFERFFQVEKENHKSIDRTGIGLSLTKGLVEMHQGKISFSSTENKGTSFLLGFIKGKNHFKNQEIVPENEDKPQYSKLPLWIDTDRIISFDEKEDATVQTQEKKHLLVVEDHLELRKFIRDELSSIFDISEAGNGLEGFNKCKELVPDIVVSDIMMPEMDGFEMCHKIKNEESTCHIPVILLTAKTSEEHQIKGFNMGADAYVSKPFNIEVLKARIKAIYESRKRIQEKFVKNIQIEPRDISVSSADEKFIEKVLDVTEKNISNPDFFIDDLTRALGMSKSTLNRKLKAVTGKTTNPFIRTMRLKRAAQLLKNQDLNISEIAYEVGFYDLDYFRDCFKKEFSVTPSQYKKNQFKASLS